MKRLWIVIILVLGSLSVSVVNSTASEDCFFLKFGKDLAPKNPNDVALNNRRVSSTKVSGLNVTYEGGQALRISWSKWPQINEDTGNQGLYASYLIYISQDKGVNWRCFNVSAARLWENFEGFSNDRDYQVVILATSGLNWSQPSTFNLSYAEYQRLHPLPTPTSSTSNQLCADSNTILNSRFSSNYIMVFVTEKTNKNLVYNLKYSIDNWKHSKSILNSGEKALITYDNGRIPLTKGVVDYLVSVTTNNPPDLDTYSRIKLSQGISSSSSTSIVSPYTTISCEARIFLIKSNTNKIYDCGDSKNTSMCKMPVSVSSKTTIDCIKGKDVLTVMGVKPVCPSGYTRK